MAFLFKSSNKVKSPQDLIKSIRESFQKLSLLLDALLKHPVESSLIDLKAMEILRDKIMKCHFFPCQLYFMRNFPPTLLSQLEGDDKKCLDKIQDELSKAFAGMKTILTGSTDTGSTYY